MHPKLLITLLSFSVVQNPGHLNYFTCMSYGPYYYRTFDGLEFLFGGRCRYTAFTDGSRTVEIGMKNCGSYSSCQKVQKIYLTCDALISSVKKKEK